MDGISLPSKRPGFRPDTTTTTAHQPGSRQSGGPRPGLYNRRGFRSHNYAPGGSIRKGTGAQRPNACRPAGRRRIAFGLPARGWPCVDQPRSAQPTGKAADCPHCPRACPLARTGTRLEKNSEPAAVTDADAPTAGVQSSGHYGTTRRQAGKESNPPALLAAGSEAGAVPFRRHAARPFRVRLARGYPERPGHRDRSRGPVSRRGCWGDERAGRQGMGLDRCRPR
jgi:hypothetical protein